LYHKKHLQITFYYYNFHIQTCSTEIEILLLTMFTLLIDSTSGREMLTELLKLNQELISGIEVDILLNNNILLNGLDNKDMDTDMMLAEDSQSDLTASSDKDLEGGNMFNTPTMFILPEE